MESKLGCGSGTDADQLSGTTRHTIASTQPPHLKILGSWNLTRMWALFSNHYHRGVRTSAVPLSRTMRHQQGTFSRAFNRGWRPTDPLW